MEGAAIATGQEESGGERGRAALERQTERLRRWVGRDLEEIERALASTAASLEAVEPVVHHLLDLGGKRLRPMCVALAARAGQGFGPAALELAVAVELVHSATLMHDDVVDLGDTRRGAPTARLVYGNAASIFAGDWLLVDALRRIRYAGQPGLLEKMLAVIEEMITAEILQLRGRGRLDVSAEHHLRIAKGKTAALFRWAMFAGARAGGLDPEICRGLEDFGLHLGIAFQIVDDVLDFAGDPEVMGKDLFADLREGKMTYPLIVAAARAPEILMLVERFLAPDGPPGPSPRELLALVTRTGALQESRELAARHAAQAIERLQVLQGGPARQFLECVAQAALYRTR